MQSKYTQLDRVNDYQTSIQALESASAFLRTTRTKKSAYGYIGYGHRGEIEFIKNVLIDYVLVPIERAVEAVTLESQGRDIVYEPFSKLVTLPQEYPDGIHLHSNSLATSFVLDEEYGGDTPVFIVHKNNPVVVPSDNTRLPVLKYKPAVLDVFANSNPEKIFVHDARIQGSDSIPLTNDTAFIRKKNAYSYFIVNKRSATRLTNLQKKHSKEREEREARTRVNNAVLGIDQLELKDSMRRIFKVKPTRNLITRLIDYDIPHYMVKQTVYSLLRYTHLEVLTSTDASAAVLEVFPRLRNRYDYNVDGQGKYTHTMCELYTWLVLRKIYREVQKQRRQNNNIGETNE